MTAVQWTVALLIAGLLGTALGGPRLIRRAAPALAHTPRAAAASLTAVVVAWPAALAAIGPALLLALDGTETAPGDGHTPCPRCTDPSAVLATGLLDPSRHLPLLLLVSPLGVTAVILSVAAVHAARRSRATARAAAAVHVGARRTRIHGHDVLLVRQDHPFAFALPRRHGGVVVSEGALGALAEPELLAVLEHERAHLRQGHHLVTALVAALAAPLRRVPLIDAAAEAVPLYLEIAADDAARRRTGTPALAGALLALGDPGHGLGAEAAPAGVLNAAGPDRIGHLVTARRGHRGRAAVLVVGALPVLLLTAWVAVASPYADLVSATC